MSKEKKVLVLVIDPDKYRAFMKKRSGEQEVGACLLMAEFKAPDPLLAEFKAKVGSVFGHYTDDPEKSRVEVKIIAIPDSLEGEQIEKGKEYRVLILDDPEEEIEYRAMKMRQEGDGT